MIGEALHEGERSVMRFDHDVRGSVVLVHEERRALEGRCGVNLEYRSTKTRDLVERHTPVVRDLHEGSGVGNVHDWGGAEITSLNRRAIQLTATTAERQAN